MNVKPTRPRGNSAIATAVEAMAAAATSFGRARPAGNTRSAYQPRKRSNVFANLSMIRHGFQLLRRAQRPASVGVTVKDVHSEVHVATTTTKANSERNLPTTPGKKAIGRNTTTSTNVITIAAKPISERPLTAASSGGSRFCVGGAHFFF